LLLLVLLLLLRVRLRLLLLLLLEQLVKLLKLHVIREYFQAGIHLFLRLGDAIREVLQRAGMKEIIGGLSPSGRQYQQQAKDWEE
jgi:hypothetical protein